MAGDARRQGEALVWRGWEEVQGNRRGFALAGRRGDEGLGCARQNPTTRRAKSATG
jgi:hypothetical protein